MCFLRINVKIQPSKLTFLLGHHLATNSLGLGRPFYKSSRQLQNFRHYGDQNGRNLEGWNYEQITDNFSIAVSRNFLELGFIKNI